ncbi:16S rRNA (cytidine(1402)-2'-O)-methyltransferase [Pelagibacterium xiamenense]|uniref:16S rRNA (cytidine(1402)-2'-O)-methyltransferase n=1 Tax=Pelagibacterium xiamenense TaxID=2901140 RepID=UPI001E3F0F05|nr:16S rRNA (cytidine(1402)-2'-O)-methyltransferase [Pelagibacterium xiamenense]MCD7058467.1 16S rRNA (cytidine(1402)-2'-O)-methyltransferase [Pelagibacterium xiamenense]
MSEPADKDYAIGTHRFTPGRPAPGLYLVATPIGNLKDITIRALDILAGADLILCEDTRHTARLCEAYAIRTPRTALHEHNERARIEGIVKRLEEGAAIALVSDAGTPLLSDPGFPLVRAAREADLPVFPVPGASALLAALTGAGLPTDAFSFIGFLPAKTGQRKNALAPLAARTETLVFYESPRRIAASLSDMAETFGPERPAVVAMEITKRFERFASGPLAELAADFDADDPKGEAVILVGGGDGSPPAAEGDWQDELATLMSEKPLRAAVDDVAQKFGLRRKEVYNAALGLKART